MIPRLPFNVQQSLEIGKSPLVKSDIFMVNSEEDSPIKHP